MTIKFRPLHDRVLIKRIEEEITSGGIVIPDNAKEKSAYRGHGGRFGFEKSLGKSRKNSGNRVRKFSRRLQDEISPRPIRNQR